MIAGHYATALIANQKFPKGTLLFFLAVSQFQDIFWFIFHYLGLEPTGPIDVFDATIANMTVLMMYSHHLLPQFFWAILVFLLGRILFKSTTIGLVALALFVSHIVLDFFSGHGHHLFGANSVAIGLGLYAKNAYLAILIEAVFMVAALTYYFREEAKAGVVRTTKNRAAIIGVFAYGIVFMVSIATVSFRDLFGLPVLNFAFNTTVPTIIFTYIAMTAVLYWAVPKTVKA
ncbi:hypothetical protein LY10_02265 [Planktotalea frisia]|jgi:hypothetical protein|uniref:Uncharacterized protein n=1 Tax=Planktotalea frisia TaxID=696762 RepID=A0A1L9NW69_9RHOB|nr:hypothetical protein [Planktotalea frisia]OJI93545.1 hypothetical protein PFRI_22400 [Planktotalea frisia]PZX27763.1 hypothetical protein LY10_02265 [Planktotalea frisia]